MGNGLARKRIWANVYYYYYLRERSRLKRSKNIDVRESKKRIITFHLSLFFHRQQIDLVVLNRPSIEKSYSHNLIAKSYITVH
jgi:hypothetical protein